MTLKRRVILIVLDSVGIGHAPDAACYHDEKANTLANVAEAMGGLHVPHLASLGLGEIFPLYGVRSDTIVGAYGHMIPQSAGKDTTNGHMEFVGVTLHDPLPTYPEGFPDVIVKEFQKRIGREILGNKPASGTEILKELGDLHVQTGKPIVYTSADSVFQIAAHESVIPLSELYAMCEVARTILTGPHAVGRVIARPFTGEMGNYTRTANRRDYSRDFGETQLTDLEKYHIPVYAIGKIEDIYGGHGITNAVHTKNNEDGVDQTLCVMRSADSPCLIFTNLVDFDMLYGHRNDPLGFGRAVEAFDRRLPELLEAMLPDDLLIITADHGCDPTTESTDHSREAVPLLIYHKGMRKGHPVGRRLTFADVGATFAAWFGVPARAGKNALSGVDVL
ncbi:phosphopentomutase [Ferroacidibacillus organovorans]|uniref:phosphopentomutase n=1 Tax=Ferroacidibacillus organovorans TaxID=1765683 RepID=UPI000B2CE4A5|nr:phosphopentomutase [Ferroacidibacillus organovorans]